MSGIRELTASSPGRLPPGKSTSSGDTLAMLTLACNSLRG